MQVKDILRVYYGKIIENCNDKSKQIDFFSIADDSRKVKSGDVFVAHIGFTNNGCDYIEEAFANGAVLAIVPIGVDASPYPFIQVEDTRECFALINIYLNRSVIPKKLLTITGTNGKTSTSNFVSQILSKLGHSNMLIGSLGVFVNGEKIEECLTNPSNADLIRYFTIAKEKNIDFVITESSSQGIHQKRNFGLSFSVRAFTNLTQDHLDYHKSMEDYFKVKRSLFLSNLNGKVVTNCDDEYGKRIYDECLDKAIPTLSYGKTAEDLKILDIVFDEGKQKVEFLYKNQKYHFTLNLVGDFQVYNVLCAIAMLLSVEISLNDILKVIPSLQEVSGRLNLIKNDKDLSIFIDYAHTPSAFEEIIKALKKHNPSKLKIVFGCGGNRDKTKRFLQGRIVALNTDVIYLTDDNPRFEDASEIRAEIEKGIKSITDSKCVYYNIAGRKDAIRKAVLELNPQEILIIAGRGEEEYQYVNGENIYLSDREEVEKALKEIDKKKK